MSNGMRLHIIYTETEMLLSKEYFSSWREIQNRYTDYKASLGPWEHEHVIEYLDSEYSDLAPASVEQVQALLDSPEQTKTLLFAATSL